MRSQLVAVGVEGQPLEQRDVEGKS